MKTTFWRIHVAGLLILFLVVGVSSLLLVGSFRTTLHYSCRSFDSSSLFLYDTLVMFLFGYITHQYSLWLLPQRHIFLWISPLFLAILSSRSSLLAWSLAFFYCLEIIWELDFTNKELDFYIEHLMLCWNSWMMH